MRFKVSIKAEYEIEVDTNRVIIASEEAGKKLREMGFPMNTVTNWGVEKIKEEQE